MLLYIFSYFNKIIIPISGHWSWFCLLHHQSTLLKHLNHGLTWTVIDTLFSKFIFISYYKINSISHPPGFSSSIQLINVGVSQGLSMVPFLSTPTTSLSSHPCHGSCQNLSPRLRCGAAYSIYSVSSHYSSLTCSLPVIYLSQLLAVPSFHLVSSETVDSSVIPFFLLHTLFNLPGKPGTLVFKTYQESNSSPHHHYYPA